eukprot:5241736-Amphidinium_carterae.1
MYGRDEQNSHESREFRAQSPRSPINPRVKEDAPSPRLVGGAHTHRGDSAERSHYTLLHPCSLIVAGGLLLLAFAAVAAL